MIGLRRRQRRRGLQTARFS